MKHPNTTPLENWPSAWLKLECASILDNPMFIAMYDHEKTAAGLPVTDEEMRKFIKESK